MEIVADIGNLSYPGVKYNEWMELNMSGGVPYLVDTDSVESEFLPGGPPGPPGPPGPGAGIPPEGLQQMFRIQYVLKMYVTPCFVGFGIICNMLSCFVLELGSEQSQSSTHYLLAKLVADTVFLLNLLCVWLTEMGVDMFKMGGWCHFTYFVSNSSNFLSLWYLVAYSIDGFIAVVYPTKTSSLCTETRAKVVISLLAVVAVPVFLNISLTVEAVDIGPASVCVPMTVFIDAVKYLGRIDMFINSILPYTSIQIILVWCLIYRVCPSLKPAVLPHPTRTSPGSPTYRINLCLYTLMLTSNLVLKLPTQALRMYEAIKAMKGTVSQNPVDYAWLQLMDFPYNASFSITILVLAIGSSSYRQSFVNICGKLPKHIRRAFNKSQPPSGNNNIEDIQATSSQQEKHRPEAV